MQYDDVITNAIWRTEAILKVFFVFGHISPSCQINAKFGGSKQNHI